MSRVMGRGLLRNILHSKGSFFVCLSWLSLSHYDLLVLPCALMSCVYSWWFSPPAVATGEVAWLYRVQFSSVQSLSHVWLFATSWIAARQASLSITNSRSLLKLMSTESVRPSNHLILCLPLFLLPSIFPSIRVVSNESVLCIRWPKYWSFSFSICPSNEYSGLISFTIDWFNFLTVQGTFKSLLQHHSSKASVLRHSAFYTVHLSHPYMAAGKTTALTIWTFVSKVMPLFFLIHCLALS